MKILVIDDDNDLNRGICSFLNSNNIATESAYNGEEGFNKINSSNFDLILSDLQMPKVDGLELLKKLADAKIKTPIIIMTAFASIENAVNAMKLGADDYLTKPVILNELLIKIKKAYNTQKIISENNELKRKVRNFEMPEILGECEEITQLKEMIKRIASDSNVPVAIYGKTGTGKELVARNIHYLSERRENNFTPINCAGLSDDLMESELFGHIKGAFTGAVHSKIGILENSDGGTIFLDEISEMSHRVQAKLLRVLQDGVIQPVGSNDTKSVDVRFLCASNQKLSELVEQNKFREDLFFRLNVIQLEIPSLLRRKDDIPLLISHFLSKYNKPDTVFNAEALQICQEYTWPGNIRELENLIRMLIVTNNKNEITKNDLPPKLFSNKYDLESDSNFDTQDYKTAFNRYSIEFEKKYLEYHLKKNSFNISKTADRINLSRVSLHKKIKEYGIDNICE